MSKKPSAELHALWQELHDEAVAHGEEFYIDPETGLMVSTATRLKARGYCCKSGCRHCPYGFVRDEV